MRRLLLISLLSAAGALIGAAPAMGVTTLTPPGTLYTINNSAGADHTDPHVDGNLVEYSWSDGSTFAVHYYDLSSGADATIPTGGGLDFLGDVNAGRIAYTHVTSSESAISLYDTTATPPSLSPVDETPGSVRRSAQIGGNDVVWQDFGFYSSGGASDIVVYNLASQTATRLTDDDILNESPTISPDGNVVAWVDCATVSSPCGVEDAVYSGGTWVTHVLTSGTATNDCGGSTVRGLTDTNGIVVVYSCARLVNGVTSSNVYFQPVGGGTEQEISWNGQGQSPSVAGNFISFAGEAWGATNHQLYVAELTAGPAPTWDGTLYQITNGTSDVQLNDTTVEADGSVTVAWQQQEAQEDIYAFNFMPESAQQQISSLGNTITGCGLPHGLTTSLLAKLNAAPADYDAGSTALVCSDLQALINEANAQSGKGITTDQANYIINSATAIRQSLGC